MNFAGMGVYFSRTGIKVTRCSRTPTARWIAQAAWTRLGKKGRNIPSTDATTDRPSDPPNHRPTHQLFTHCAFALRGHTGSSYWPTRPFARTLRVSVALRVIARVSRALRSKGDGPGGGPGGFVAAAGVGLGEEAAGWGAGGFLLLALGLSRAAARGLEDMTVSSDCTGCGRAGGVFSSGGGGGGGGLSGCSPARGARERNSSTCLEGARLELVRDRNLSKRFFFA